MMLFREVVLSLDLLNSILGWAEDNMIETSLIGRSVLDRILATEIVEFDLQARRWWDLISITPERWNNTYWPRAYWVVGLIGKRALWFEHIEKQWCLSPFSVYGQIEANHTDGEDLSAEIYRLGAYIDGDDAWRAWLQLA